MTSAGFCQAVQAAVLVALEGDEDSSGSVDKRRVATFGNSNPEKVGDWVSILVSNKPSVTSATVSLISIKNSMISE